MPIKLPKGFSRRKSSATALEEVANPPQPSFRVFERPPGGSKSFDGGIALKRMSQGRPLSSPSGRVDENLFDDERDDSDPSHRLVGDGDSSWSARLTYGRGSGGTHHSSSTGVLYDTSSSSARFSSSTSTLPSSTDATPDEPQNASGKALPDIPPPPIPNSQPAFSVRAAGRTFSFGRKAIQASGAGSTSKAGTAEIEPRQSTATTRERAMTESSFASASTATPPKLLDADFNLGGSDLDGFGTMFESFDKRRSRVLDGQGITLLPSTASPEAISPPTPAVPPKSYSGERSRFTPSPINIDRTRIIDSSPYSWGSHDSRDGLMSSSTPPAPFHSFDPRESPPVPRHGNSRALTPSKTKPLSATASPTLQSTDPYSPRQPSNSLDDSIAQLPITTERPRPAAARLSAAQTRTLRGIADSISGRADKGEHGIISTSSSDVSLSMPSYSCAGQIHRDTVQEADAPAGRYTSVALFDSEDPEVAGMSNSWRGESTETTPRAKKLEPVRQQESPIFDSYLTASATLAAQYEESVSTLPTKQGQRHKVMTPAQFERYRRQQEMTRTKSTSSMSEASEDVSDMDDDDDETERNRQAARQRRKQEAHLAIYRQQMMKVTGEQPAELPLLGPNRSGFDRSSSGTPTMSNRMSTVNSSVERLADSSRFSDEEDEDVPLGILAAHGFPSKHRPPSHLGNASPKSIHRASMQSIPSAPGSIAGESAAGGPRNGLPPFARNLPQDPYYGASLVNPSNREFLNNSGGSVYGGPQPSRPPGGLVGVIAGEERARAMRRGSPNAQGVYGPSGALGAGMPQMYPGMPRPTAVGNMNGLGQQGMPGMPPVPMMSSGDQAQFQMTQQMAQMMQVQMQWMQQMMQMQGIQPNGQPLPPQHSPAPTQQMGNNGFLSPPVQTQRPMSMGSHMAQSTISMPQINQRAMSMLDPSMSWDQSNGRKSTLLPSMSGALGNQSYTPSIAPSERSNVGMPSRYRPVSIAAEPESMRPSSRTSTFTSGNLQGWTETQEGPSAGKATTIKKLAGRDSDEDEDEGWEEMRRKRENKKSTWRLRKSANGLQDMYYPGT